MLTNDSRWRLYNLADLRLAEQTFHLNTGGTLSGRYSLHGADGAAAVTGFGFGPPVSWGLLTVFFLAADGAVYALCPVTPFGEPCAPSHTWGVGIGFRVLVGPVPRHCCPAVAVAGTHDSAVIAVPLPSAPTTCVAAMLCPQPGLLHY